MAGYFYRFLKFVEVFVAELNSENDEQNQLCTIEERSIGIDDHNNAKQFMLHFGLLMFNEHSSIYEKRTKATETTKSSARVCFEDVVELYNFDRKLRLLSFDAIERIEISLKATWASHFSTSYGSRRYVGSR